MASTMFLHVGLIVGWISGIAPSWEPLRASMQAGRVGANPAGFNRTRDLFRRIMLGSRKN